METAVLLCVPEADGVVGRWRAEGDPSAALGVPAHVTVLYPFVPTERLDEGVVAELAWFFSHIDPLEVVFARTERFPDTGVLFLAPQDDDLDHLLAALHRRWPECPPYGGVHDGVRAHLTVLVGEDEALHERAGAAVQEGLPLHATLAEAQLWSEGADGRWSCTARFPLG